MRYKKWIMLLPILALLMPISAQERYEKPPQETLNVLNAPLAPSSFLSPNRQILLLAQPMGYPAIADLAEPMLRLAGVRVNPRTNAEVGYRNYWTSYTLKKLPFGQETSVVLPKGMRLGYPVWNADGSRFAFTNEALDRVELWIVDSVSGQARQVPGIALNPTLGSHLQWLPDQKTLLIKAVPADRPAPPQPPLAPPAPKIQENTGATTASSTYEVRDVLRSPYDADLFDYYTTSRLLLVDASSLAVTKLGQADLFVQVAPSPDGRYLLVERIKRPYSFQRAYYRFPKEIEIWDRAGRVVEKLASIPLADQVPIDGVPTGMRDQSWRPTAPATLVWTQALDEGNPQNKVPFRDCLMAKEVGSPVRELFKTEQRSAGLDWIGQGGQVLLADVDNDRHWQRTFLADADAPEKAPKLLWDMSWDEKYAHPGYPVYQRLANGESTILHQGDWIYLTGMGSSPQGDRPFLDRLNLRNFKTERLFHCDKDSYEFFVAWLDPAAGKFITRRETPSDPPNFYLRSVSKANSRPITHFPNPFPQLAGISKQLVSYARADGTPLSFMLYLPPGYKTGTRLPTVLWAYPLDYTQVKIAGQIDGSAKRFNTMRGTSELFFLLNGYAVLSNAAMPVVGDPKTAYDSFVDQIVANAKAAIDKAVELGVTDPERVGVGGHSHGALMTANLLAYSDLFRAGIARSGAFNHTMRPFGFQNEKRTLWQARDTYIKLSPVLNADKINEPLLLIHGEIDANPGTVPMQSEKLYDCLRGLGATARLVMLPYENHGYSARESTEHVLYEMISWFDRFVKNAPPRGQNKVTSNQ